MERRVVVLLPADNPEGRLIPGARIDRASCGHRAWFSPSVSVALLTREIVVTVCMHCVRGTEPEVFA